MNFEAFKNPQRQVILLTLQFWLHMIQDCLPNNYILFFSLDSLTLSLFSHHQMILKSFFAGRQHISFRDLERHKKPGRNLICLECHLNADKKNLQNLQFPLVLQSINLTRKQVISTALSIEKPVRRPIVPPTRPSCASIVTFEKNLINRV